jgi:hypothetical protein
MTVGESDGLVTGIGGIGEARAAALWDLGIVTVTDLVGASAPAVAAMLDGVTVEMVEGWQADAGAAAVRANDREEAVSAGAEGRETAVGPGQPANWKPAADGKSARADAASAGSTSSPSRGLDPLRELYEEGVWRDQRQWRCRMCPFDTLKGEEVIRAHVAKQHVLGSRGAADRDEEASQILVARR